MPKVEVFDPPMCCSTGVCGPAVDPSLVRFAADLDWLKQHGVEVARFNLAQDPGAFVTNPVVAGALREGNDVLPLLLVDGVIASKGSYPDRDLLARLTRVSGGAPLASRPRDEPREGAPSRAKPCCGPAGDAPVALGRAKGCC